MLRCLKNKETIGAEERKAVQLAQGHLVGVGVVYR